MRAAAVVGLGVAAPTGRRIDTIGVAGPPVPPVLVSFLLVPLLLALLLPVTLRGPLFRVPLLPVRLVLGAQPALNRNAVGRFPVAGRPWGRLGVQRLRALRAAPIRAALVPTRAAPAPIRAVPARILAGLGFATRILAGPNLPTRAPIT